MKRISTIAARGREFYIVQNQQGFWGIESSKFSDGVLQEKINGLQGFLTNDASKTEQMVRQAIEVDALERSGWDRIDATIAVVRDGLTAEQAEIKKTSGRA